MLRPFRNECAINDAILQYAFTQYSLKEGLRKFPDETRAAVAAEMQQLHDRETFTPVHKYQLTRQELKEALESLIFLKQKRCGRFKARTCADGRPQRLLYAKHESSSPTIRTESVILTSVIDAAGRRDVGIYDIPGAFLNVRLEETVHIKVRGELARMLIQIDPERYAPFAIYESGHLVIYLLLTRALYGCLKSALQFWKHLSGNLTKRGYVTNPYDPCVANKEINGSQFTVVWHVDDLKLSHEDPKVVDKEVEWLETIYGPMVGTRGKVHTYLGMDLDFSVDGEVRLTMVPYLQEILDEFPDDWGKPVSTPAANHLFDEQEDSVLLDEEKSKTYHHVVAKMLWAALRARPDLLTALSFLTSKVQSPNVDDYKKLCRTLSYLAGTITLPLILSADGTHVIKWWVDASFATRREMRSQTGGTMSMGRGSIFSTATKQKLVTKSSTEAELVGADDVMSQMVWTRNFLLAQGFEVKRNVLFQDNQSAMLLERNGIASSSRRTRHINIRFFFIKVRVTSKEIELEFCPTDEMVGDYFTKPLQGAKFREFRKIIMEEPDNIAPNKECVEASDEK